MLVLGMVLMVSFGARVAELEAEVESVGAVVPGLRVSDPGVGVAARGAAPSLDFGFGMAFSTLSSETLVLGLRTRGARTLGTSATVVAASFVVFSVGVLLRVLRRGPVAAVVGTIAGPVAACPILRVLGAEEALLAVEVAVVDILKLF